MEMTYATRLTTAEALLMRLATSSSDKIMDGTLLLEMIRAISISGRLMALNNNLAELSVLLL